MMLERPADTWTHETFTRRWPEVAAILAKIGDVFPEDETARHLAWQILTGRKDLWIAHDESGIAMVALTALVPIEATGETILQITDAGGERLNECLPLLEQIEEWAQSVHGITRVRVCGRSGWMRRLRAHGYNKKLIMAEKRLEKKNA